MEPLNSKIVGDAPLQKAAMGGYVTNGSRLFLTNYFDEAKGNH